MRIEYLAHASLLVEAGGVRLVTDPWLDGPTYLDAWWQFPEPARRARELGAVDYVYLTHEHADHFHPPTLARLPPGCEVLVGRFFTPRFGAELARLGLRVRELPHGETVQLGDGLALTSYQFRADDTALVLRDGSATVLDLNDSLFRGRALAQIVEAHPTFDLMLASFANAEAYPIVYELDDAGERPDWDDEQRFGDFLGKVRDIAPRAFAPFASMFCFLSDELFDINARIVTPERLLARARTEVAAEGLALNPGDVWTPERGHEVVSQVRWGDKAALVAAYAARQRDEVQARRRAEVVPGGVPALRAAFADFFRGWWQRVPWVLRRRLELTLCFELSDAADARLWLRCAGGRLSLEAPAEAEAWEARVRIAAFPLWRAVTRAEWWQSLGISCRFRVRLRAGVRAREVLFWTLLYLDDLGYLTPATFANRRALSVGWARRRELLDYLGDAARGRFVASQLRGKFGRGR